MCCPANGWLAAWAKAPLLPARDGLGGFHDASRDPEVITGWWARWPDAMIGAVIPADLVVLDVDPRNGGTLEKLETALGPLPPTLTCISGRGDGGFHAYYRRPAGELSSVRLPAGVDLKKTGYLIVPPSIHPDSGRVYRWMTRPVVDLPEAAVTALRPPAPRRQLANALASSPDAMGRKAEALIRAVADAPEGRRNGRLFWAACRALEEGHAPDVLEELGAVAETIGLDPREVQQTMRSAERRVTA